ncbi:MAG TPA: NADH-quinone oxidoreductase subunit J [Cyclobacteriaceae bacterium]|jgi:NADH-quinone oxidoreductase subunit J
MNTDLLIFFISGGVAIVATILVITQYNMIHALLYLIVSFLALAVVFYVLGAPFAAALEVIVYAGAIVVLIIFVIMMLNLKKDAEEQERSWLTPGVWVGPGILCAILMIEILFVMLTGGFEGNATQAVGAPEVGRSLYGPYLIAVELSGLLLMAGTVGAYHLGRQRRKVIHRFLEMTDE